MIVIDFPSFTGGRDYSTARLLRERVAVTGELRAIGDMQRMTLAQRIDEAAGTLARIAREHAPAVFASSFGAEDMVLLDLVCRHAPSIGVFTLDTGRLPEETAALIAQSRGSFGLPIEVFYPDATALQSLVGTHGINAFYESVELRQACCGIRKTEPLRRALRGKAAWVTGLRRSQAATRSGVPVQEFDEVHGLPKFNPLAEWSEDDVWTYIRERQVPYNALHDRGYRSIGCAPCTRATAPGEDVRAGRWWWESPEHKECGLHQRPAPKSPPPECDRSRGIAGCAIADATPVRELNETQGLPGAAEATHLAWLEAEAIHILREVAGQCRHPALLFSGGKDSLVLLRLAEKAFRPGRFPFPLVHIDTGHNFEEVIAFRDARAAELGERLIVRSVDDSIAAGRVVLKTPDESRNVHQSVTLLDTIAEFHFDACIGGARRDEEKSRAKERIFSFRDTFGQWDPRRQRPELWDLYNGRVHPGEHVRVFPISNWTELDIWQYIVRERLAVPSIYYAHRRKVVRRKGALVPVTALTPARAGETVEELSVRFRTVGDITCTAPVASTAATAEAIVLEAAAATVTERGATRLDDQTNDASMELRKKAGYF